MRTFFIQHIYTNIEYRQNVMMCANIKTPTRKGKKKKENQIIRKEAKEREKNSQNKIA